MTLYDRIRKRREKLGMSQEELAYILGYKSRSTINKIETGINDITQSKIIAFANALKVSPAYLMGFEVENMKGINTKHDVQTRDNRIKKLKEIREEMSLSKKQVAHDLNIPYSTYNNWEIGARDTSSDVLIKLSNYYNVSIDYIMGLTDNRDKQNSQPISYNDKIHLELYNRLNCEGKRNVDNHIEDILGNPKYKNVDNDVKNF